MKDLDKNRDQVKARKRAATDAKCALRKLHELACLVGIGREIEELERIREDVEVISESLKNAGQ